MLGEDNQEDYQSPKLLRNTLHFDILERAFGRM